MVDKEDEKKQFTINVSSVNQLENPVRDRIEENKSPKGKETTKETQTLITLLREVLERTKVPVAVLIFALVAGGIGLTYLPTQPKAQEAASQGSEIIEAGSSSASSMGYEELLEMRMETILGNLDGAGQTKVMITTSGSTEKVLAEEIAQNIQDTDETTNAGNRKTSEKQDIEKKVVMEKGGTPFVIKENKPKVEGVLVLAEGADDTNIKNAIIQSVSSLLDVPVHKISVYKMVNN